MTLETLILDIEKKSKDIIFGCPGWEGENYLETEPYYKWLASYVREYKPKRILELGRRAGNSLFALAKFLPDESVLDSYDLNGMGKTVDKINVNVLEYDGDFSKLDLGSYDFIFVDINGKGPQEWKIYNQMIEQGYKGVTAWDDVNSEHCLPEFFWHKVTKEKLLTNYNNSGSGFGFIII